jgi:DNA-binding IscR family transcriptional regulator
MKSDSRLSSVLHVLLHIAHSDRPLTSEELAAYLHTNSVVVRRVLAGLRACGLVGSVKGPGGGWSLTCDPKIVTLQDVYDAVGAPPLFAIGNRKDNPRCLVELAVNTALDDALRDAEALLIGRFARVSLADLSADFNRRFAAQPRKKKHAHAH